MDLAQIGLAHPAGRYLRVMNERRNHGPGSRVNTQVARHHALKIVTVADIIAYRLKNETFVQPVAEAAFPTEFGDFKIVVFENLLDQDHHIALVKGEVAGDEPVMVRVHSQSTVDDVFYSLRSGGHNELRSALKSIQLAGKGVLVYLRQEDKGSNLVNEIKSYALQDAGGDSVGKFRHCFRY